MITPVGMDSNNNINTKDSSISEALPFRSNDVNQDQRAKVQEAFLHTLYKSPLCKEDILRDLMFYGKIDQEILNGKISPTYASNWHDDSYKKRAEHYVNIRYSLKLYLLGSTCETAEQQHFGHMFAYVRDLVPDITEHDRYKILSELFFDANKEGYVGLVEVLYDNVDQNGRDKLLKTFLEYIDSQSKNKRPNILKSLLIDSKIDKRILNKQKTLPDNDQLDIAPKVRLFLLDGVCKVTPVYFKELLSVLYSSNSTREPDECHKVLSELLLDAEAQGYLYLATTLFFNDNEQQKNINPKELSDEKLLEELLELLNEENKKEQGKHIDIVKDLVNDSKLDFRIHPSQYVSPRFRLFLLDGICNIAPVYFKMLLSDLYSSSCTTPSDKFHDILSMLLFDATKDERPHLVTTLLNHAKIDHNKQDEIGKTAAMYGLDSRDEAVATAYIGFIKNDINTYLKPVDQKGRNLLYYLIDLMNEPNFDKILHKLNILYKGTGFNFNPEYINSIYQGHMTPLVYAATVIKDDKTYFQLANDWQKNSADVILALFLSAKSGQACNVVLPRLIQTALSGLHEASKTGGLRYNLISYVLNCRYQGYSSKNKHAKFSKIEPDKVGGRGRKIYKQLSEQSKTQLYIDQLRKQIPELLDKLEEEATQANCIDDLANLLSLLFKEYAEECNKPLDVPNFVQGIETKNMRILKALVVKYFAEKRYAVPFGR